MAAFGLCSFLLDFCLRQQRSASYSQLSRFLVTNGSKLVSRSAFYTQDFRLKMSSLWQKECQIWESFLLAAPVFWAVINQWQAFVTPAKLLTREIRGFVSEGDTRIRYPKDHLSRGIYSTTNLLHSLGIQFMKGYPKEHPSLQESSRFEVCRISFFISQGDQVSLRFWKW